MGDLTRVLIVEDLEADAELAEYEIAKALGPCEFRRVETRETYLSALETFRPALIVSDFQLPYFDGLTALELAKERAPDVPFIVVTGSMNEDTAVECMKAGAWDYVIKEHVKRLGPAANNALARQHLRAERRRAQLALEASEIRYRGLFEASQDGILILDANTGKIVDVNPFLTELTGYSREDFLAKHLWEIGPFKDVGAAKDSFAELLAKQYVRYEDLPLESRDGRQIEVEFVSSVYRADNQSVIQCNIRDITARRQQEAKREQLEEQLRKSRKMDAIGSLAGGVAHDFNNLLSVILSYTAFAMTDGIEENEPLKADLEEVKKAADRAAVLTQQLLAFGRKQVLQPVPLDLNQIATGFEKMLRRILGEDIYFDQVLAADLGLTLADPCQIEQVLMNLVVNARDAMPEGGRLTIETSNAEIDEDQAARRVGVSSGSYVQLAVTDTGCGMDEQTKARVFEPFFTTKEPGRGTGLGLSTVYGIVKQSGGNIRICSELGKGTTFRVYLPRDLSARKASSIKSMIVPRRVTGTETILVVDDEDTLCKVTKRALKTAGYTVLTAANGDEALLRCAQHAGDIHLLLTDVVMPRMSGVTLAEVLLRTRPALKVLYMSGYTGDSTILHGALDAGTHFLAKPFTAGDLQRKVRQVLDEDIARDSGGPTSIPGDEVAV